MNHIKLIRCADAEAAGKAAATLYTALIQSKPDCLLGLATGSTPIPLYKELVKLYEAGELDFSKVRSVNLDEYKGLSGDHPQSYRYFMNDNLFDHVNIQKENTIVPDGLTEDVEAMCDAYEEKIEAWGGIDLQLLGIGHDGHIGFNEPADHFPVNTHCVDLTEETIEANKRFFASRDDVPRQAYTMGVGTIMNARKVLLIASGADKAEIIKKSFFGPVTPEIPASILQMHPDFTLVCDEAALSLV